MSLCRLMVMDCFKDTGRYCEETGQELYSNMDLRFGVAYAQAYLEEGIKYDPIQHFPLRIFMRWAIKNEVVRKK